MKKSLLFFSVLLALVCIFSCEKESKEENKPYAGKWESNIFPAVNPSNGDTILQKMSFEFTNTTFTDAIAQSKGITDLNLVVQATIGGTVDNFISDSLKVAINTISLVTGAQADRLQDPTTFNSLFDLALGSLLYKDFNAGFSFYSDNDSMKLALPVKFMGMKAEQTIRLGKMK